MTERMSLAEYRVQQSKRTSRYVNHSLDEMNATEARYAQELEAQRRSGQIISWAYQPHTLQIAPNTLYTPDFGIVDKQGYTFVEIKGYLRDDASVKYRVAKNQNLWATWKMLRWDKKKGWTKVRI